MSSIFLVVVLLALMLAGNFFIFIPSISADNPALPNLNDYLAYFYNRYSQHLDAHGFVFKTPDYDVENFSAPDSAREILSLALYYKYRALSGEAGALVKVKQAVLDAEQELSSRPTVTLSFSDGFAEMATISLLNSFPTLFESTEKDLLYENILKRIPAGFLAADTSNRAALSAVYWQFVLNDFFQKKWISPGDYERLSKLIYEKIKMIRMSWRLHGLLIFLCLPNRQKKIIIMARVRNMPRHTTCLLHHILTIFLFSIRIHSKYADYSMIWY